ncbi:MAG: hypothetical protein EBR09_14990 [Proteobacteria bacterium]|nr:hypothetical protein [Pseudomonadota bacterium]
MRAGVLTSLPGAAWNACADCGAGKYSTATGATVSATCVDCAAGKFSATAASFCADCAAGKYQDAVTVTTNPAESSRTYSSVCCGDVAGGAHGSSMLDNPNSWCPGFLNPAAYGSWVQIDLGSNLNVLGVVAQPRGDAYSASMPWYYSGNVEWEVQYSLSTSGFVSATSTSGSNRFTSVGTAGTQVKSELYFNQPVVARYIKMIAQVITNTHLCARVGVLTSSVISPISCTDCGAGKYSTATGALGASTCQSCPSNSLSATGSDAATDCECAAGFSGPAGGPCTACAAGKYKAADGSAACVDCGAGKYSSAVGAAQASTCVDCPSNANSTSGSNAASSCKCNPGTRVDVCAACASCASVCSLPCRARPSRLRRSQSLASASRGPRDRSLNKDVYLRSTKHATPPRARLGAGARPPGPRARGKIAERPVPQERAAAGRGDAVAQLRLQRGLHQHLRPRQPRARVQRRRLHGHGDFSNARLLSNVVVSSDRWKY